MIDAKDLLHGHALSFRTQVSLQTLIEAIRDPAVKITFVVGAGLSINAGLPNWAKLLDNVCDAIANPRFAELARGDTSDTLRKSEYSLHLAEALGSSDERALIRDALYKDNLEPRPGPLHNALARLASKLRGRARIVTTNYDTLLEVALRDYFPTAEVNEWGPDYIQDWQKAAVGAADVLHVHGILEPKKPTDQTVVFTESHFFSHGPAVRELIGQRLATDVVIFIGVSLTDPNLTSPLWEYRSQRTAASPVGPFVLSVPDIADPNDLLLSYEFAIQKAAFFEDKLMTLPIFLKSFSQLAQLVWEMTYALDVPTAYTRNRGKDLTLTYGSRFKTVLTKSYSSVGCAARSDFLGEAAAIDLSKSLDAMLGTSHALGKELKRLERVYPRLPGDAGVENLGIYLWLRTRSHGSVLASYTVTMIGTSAYISRASWTMPRPVPISAESDFAVSKAVYFGSAIAENIGFAEPGTPWRGTLAVPLRLERDGDTHTIGAVSLHTNRPVKGSGAEKVSLIGRITKAADYSSLADHLEKSAQTLLSSNWP